MTTRSLPLLLLAAAAGLSCSQQDFVTDVPLRVVSITATQGSVTTTAAPGADAGTSAAPVVDTFVPRDTDFEITFSERLAEGTVAGAITLEALGPTGTDPAIATPTAIPIQVTYQESPVPTVTVTPFEEDNRVKLPFTTALRLNISPSLKRLRDNGPLPVQVRWLANTVNPPPLRVVSLLPSGGAAGVARDAQVKVVFSEPLQCAGLSGMTVSELADLHPHTAAGDTAVAVPGSWECPTVDPAADETLEGTTCAKNPAPCTVTFKPEATGFRFKYSSQVTLKLSGAASETPVRSVRATDAGGALLEDVTSSFRVVDPPVLALATAIPANGATGVAPNALLTLAFTEPVDCETLTNTTAKVEQVVDDHPRFGARKGTTETVGGSWACAGNTAAAGEGEAACAGTNAANCQAVFTPTTPFLPSAVVKVTVAGGAYEAGKAPAARDRVESLRATIRGGQLQTAVTFQVRAADPSPLAVTLSTPGNGASNVPVSPPPELEVQFSRTVDCDSVTAATASATLTLPDSTTQAWPVTVDCQAGNYHLTLKPQSSTPLPYGTEVTVTLQGGTYTAGSRVLEASDATTYGGQLPADVVLSFKMGEPPALLLASALPSPGSTGSGFSEPIVLSFSEPVDCATVNGTTVLVEQTPAPLATGAPVPGTTAVPCTFTCPLGGDARKAQCAHAPFSPSASVKVTLVGGTGTNTAIQSDAATPSGGQLPVDVSWTYRAADPAPLAVVGTSPNGNPGNNVSAKSDVRFTFSRAVRCSTVAGRLTLVRDDTGAAVPGTLTCTNGAQVGPAVDGSVAIFTPSAPLEVLKRYRATALAGIQALDATLLGTTAQGTLPADVSTRFDVEIEHLQVLATTPAAGAQLAPIGSSVVLQFNQELAPTSLVPCTPSSNKASCNVVVTRGATPFNWTNGTLATSALEVDGTPTYEGGTRKWTLDPSDAANAPYLVVAMTYTASIKGGTAGPVGANGVSTLPLDYTFTFRTSSAQLVLGVLPDDLAADVESTDPVCIDFVGDVDASTLTAGGNQLTLSYTDDFGRSAALPLDATTPYTLSDASGAGTAQNRVCLNLLSATYACVPGEHRLRPGTTFTATVSTAVKVGSSFPAAPVSWSFTTRPPPALSGIRVANAVISEQLLDGATEVPVNGAFAVTFAEPMDPASLTSTNLRLVPLGNAPAVVTTVTLPAGVAYPQSATLTTPNLGHKSATVDGRYAVQLLGGTDGVATATGHTLEADVRVAFTTCPATAVTLSPPEAQLTPNALVPLVADRALHLPSVTSETLFATLAGSRINGIVALQPAQPRAATYIPNPLWLTNNGGPYKVRTSTGMLDYRGNPVPETASQNFSTGNTPANNAIQPSLLTATNAAQVANSQSFVLTLGGTSLKERSLSTSWYSVAGGGGSIALEALGGTGCPQPATKLAVDSVLAPATTAATTDKVNIKVLPPLYMAAGCQYVLKVRQAQAANLYNQGNQGPEISFNAVGESVAPTLNVLEVQKPDGTFTALTGSSAASGRVVVRATFNEPLASDSVTDLSFRVADTGGALTGTLSTSGAVVTWTSSSPVAAGTNLAATLDAGLRDLAGNAFAGTAQSFTVESTTPDFTAVAWSPTATRDAPYGTATVTFTEPVDPATLHCNTQSAVGSLSFKVGATKLFGCAVLSSTNPNEVLWRPVDPVGTQVTVDVTTNPAGAAPQLKDLAGAAVPFTTRSFTTP
ncbi:MAG: Ig-like domain-containing protein [Deltaproteobacteria bacterium]|nr:Ig-like domain-containing protein [Deltaproteobacteria bacterium]